MKEYNISFFALNKQRLFPKDTLWWGSGAEICGYSPSTYKFFIVDDGMCCDDTGCWLVHGWRLKEPFDFKRSLVKYVDDDYDEGDGVKILEQWIMFRDFREDIAPIEALYDRHKANNEATIVFVAKDKCCYTFGKDAETAAELCPGFPVAYMMTDAPILAFGERWWCEMEQHLSQAGRDVKKIQ